MNTDTLDHGDESLNCPKCGAPTDLAPDLGALTLTCQYCAASFPVPRGLREIQERRALQRRRTTSAEVTRSTLVVLIGVVLGIGGLVAGIGLFMTRQKPSPAPVEPPSPVAPIVAGTSRMQAEDTRLEAGEARVEQLLLEHKTEDCNPVLLEPTRIVGGRAIDAKLVANGACVRFLAATGTPGDGLELTMRSPAGKRIETPKVAAEIDFLYCAKRAGLYSAEIRSTSERPFTVSSIECPRR